MGLIISVGVYSDLLVNDVEGAAWMRRDLKALNDALAGEGLPAHREPERLPALSHPSVGSIPYSFLHYLRRAVAYSARPETAARFGPLEDGVDPTRDQVVDEEQSMMWSHVLGHADGEGYYVPLDFRDTIVSSAVTGELIGSSFRVLDELRAAAPLLEIALETDGRLSEAEGRALSEARDGEHPLWRERLAWYALYTAAVASVRYKTLIVFM